MGDVAHEAPSGVSRVWRRHPTWRSNIAGELSLEGLSLDYKEGVPLGTTGALLDIAGLTLAGLTLAGRALAGRKGAAESALVSV